jgi:hypothetical protein
MKQREFKTPRAEKLFLQLCKEVDYWKDMAESLEYELDAEKKRYNQLIDERLKDSQMQLGNMLTFALAVTDNPDGSMSISKEDRERIANSIKTE